MPNPRNAGPKPKIKTQLDEELKSHPKRILDLMAKLYDRGMEGDIPAAVYYINRVMGMPTAKVDANIKQISFTPDDLLDMPMLLEIARDRQTKLLEEGKSYQIEPIIGADSPIIGQEDSKIPQLP